MISLIQLWLKYRLTLNQLLEFSLLQLENLILGHFIEPIQSHFIIQLASFYLHKKFLHFIFVDLHHLFHVHETAIPFFEFISQIQGTFETGLYFFHLRFELLINVVFKFYILFDDLIIEVLQSFVSCLDLLTICIS